MNMNSDEILKAFYNWRIELNNREIKKNSEEEELSKLIKEKHNIFEEKNDYKKIYTEIAEAIKSLIIMLHCFNEQSLETKREILLLENKEKNSKD